MRSQKGHKNDRRVNWCIEITYLKCAIVFIVLHDTEEVTSDGLKEIGNIIEIGSIERLTKSTDRNDNMRMHSKINLDFL